MPVKENFSSTSLGLKLQSMSNEFLKKASVHHAQDNARKVISHQAGIELVPEYSRARKKSNFSGIRFLSHYVETINEGNYS